jgi:hypothetical protein
MRRDREPCPDCEAPQAFPLRHRFIEGRPGVIEVYIACTVCLFEQELRISTPEIERLRGKKAQLEGHASMQERKHGVVNSITARQIEQVDSQIVELEKAL